MSVEETRKTVNKIKSSDITNSIIRMEKSFLNDNPLFRTFVDEWSDYSNYIVNAVDTNELLESALVYRKIADFEKRLKTWETEYKKIMYPEKEIGEKTGAGLLLAAGALGVGLLALLRKRK